MRVLVLLVLVALLATPAAAAERHICWRGENGYTMTGTLTFPDRLAGAALIDESQIDRLVIEGWLDGRPLGRWDSDDRTDRTTWLLRYSPRQGRFPLLGGGIYQAWNANGLVDDCGSPGFGFNAGNGGQDVCVDGVFRTDSTIAWDTPILTYGSPRDPLSCSNEPLMGKRRGTG